MYLHTTRRTSLDISQSQDDYKQIKRSVCQEIGMNHIQVLIRNAQ